MSTEVLVTPDDPLDAVPADVFTALPGVSDVSVEDHTLRLRVSGAITPVVQAAARYELLDFVSREPSLEETFLAQYGTAGEAATEREAVAS